MKGSICGEFVHFIHGTFLFITTDIVNVLGKKVEMLYH